MVNLILNEGWPQKKAAESVGIHVKSASYYVGQERKRRIDAARAAVLEPTLAITPPVEQHVEQAIAIPMPPPSEALRQSLGGSACSILLRNGVALFGQMEYAEIRVLPPPIRACIDELLDYVGTCARP